MPITDTPELEDLYFFQQLVSSYSDLYARAQNICSIIVIPQHVSNQSSLNRDIMESHLFRPSPYFVRKHLSYNDKYEIEFDANRTLKVTQKIGGAVEKRIKVLSQEEVRDSVQNRSYNILIVEQPIVDIDGSRTLLGGAISNKLTPKSSTSSQSKFDTASATYGSAFLYLDSLRPIEAVFGRLRENLFLFNESYVILPNYVHLAIDKLGEYRDQFLREAYHLLNRPSEDRELELASEIYITGNTYTKVWPVVVQHNEKKDQELINNIIKRQKKLLVQSNEHDFSGNLNAENELRKADDYKTAYEKAKCIRSVLESAIAAKTLMIVDAKKSAVSYRSSIDEPAMAADETLTAFIDLICHFVSTAKSDESIHLFAHGYYIEKFRFVSLPQDVGYAFTTYQGALEYLKNSALSF